MIRPFLFAFSFLLAVPAFAQPVTVEALRAHVDVLASDDFEGREPGTDGERKTLAYLSSKLRRYGLEPAGPDGSWFQPVTVEVRRPQDHRIRFRGSRKRDSIAFDGDSMLLLGRTARETLSGAPVYFAGHGAVIPDKGIDQLAGAELDGAVVLILYDGPDLPGFPHYADRVKAVAGRGAAAVIGIVGKELPWPVLQRIYEGGQNRLPLEPPAPIQGSISQAAAERLARTGRTDLARLLDAAPGASRPPVQLKLTADLEVATDIRTIATHNLVGRLKGSGGSGESVLYLAHWDHLGICAPPTERDRICNGAVDNASGLAVMLEIARALAKGPRPKRDILFLGTTAEEMGLLGAEHFVARPPVPIRSILAAINLDTVAIAPRGEKVAVLGGGVEALDALIDRAIAVSGRTRDRDEEAASFITRQDGWAFARAGVPAIMVGGSFSDMAKLQAFLRGPYHGPEDNPGPGVALDGAAEDADLLIRLGRLLADPAHYSAPGR